MKAILTHSEDAGICRLGRQDPVGLALRIAESIAKGIDPHIYADADVITVTVTAMSIDEFRAPEKTDD